MTPPIVTTVSELRTRIAAIRRAGETLALVPTMGALHEGHLDLVRLARSKASRAVVSVFVNPRQFAPHEDFDRYPRNIAADAARLATVAADLIWAPAVDEMYPPGFATRIEMGGPALGLETDFRPHFVGGVATVCCKLFSQATPDLAIFGEKDYQQLTVLRQLVRDLNLPLTIIGAPTRRDPDGLALASRNAYLSQPERAIAPGLHRALLACASAITAGTPIDTATSQAVAAVLKAGFAKVDYLACRDAATLGPPPPAAALIPATAPPTGPATAPPTGPATAPPADPATVPTTGLRLLAAAWLGKTRLIDNIGV